MKENNKGTVKKKTKAALWLPVLIWMALIFSASSISFPSSKVVIFRFQDKLAHLFEFGVLGLLLVRAIYYGSEGGKSRYLWCVLGVALYGALDELHQAFVPGRLVELGDIIADGLGALIFAWAWLAWRGEGFISVKKPGLENNRSIFRGSDEI